MILREIHSHGLYSAAMDKTVVPIGASNGTKSLSLSGLTYSTTYKVWVNATDPTGSNQ